MSHCLIGLGSNLGDRSGLLDAATNRIDSLPETRVISRSGFYETLPVGGPSGQGSFLNAAILIETALSPQSLLDETARIEREQGRVRAERWGPRSIDLDLLLYDDLVIDSGGLQLPHPRMAWRRFVLKPAAEAAPTMWHPKIGWTIRQLLNHVETATAYVAIAGLPGAGKSQLAQSVVEVVDGTVISDPVVPSFPQFAPDNSYGFQAEGEIECARRRADAVDVGSPVWKESRRCWISDFWLGESASAIQAWSEAPCRDELFGRLREATQQARRPKLTVLLDAPAEWCIQRVAERRAHELKDAALPRIESLRAAIGEQLCGRDVGPLLRLDAQHPAHACEELAAAIAAMES